MDSAVIVKNVTFAYKNEEGEMTPDKALNGISLDIKAGSYCAVLGPNGSGKSTLAKIIDVLETPDEGGVVVLGVVPDDEDKCYEIRENCSYVFQNPDNQIVGTVVEEDVAFGPENLGVPLPELRERVDAALKYTGLYELKDREAATLSGGQKQKLAIAGALAMDPKILILDESTAMLDPVSRDEFLDLVESLNREKGITVITITHDMNEAARCGKIFVIEDGQVTMEGTPAYIFSHPDAVKKAGLDLPQDIDLIYELAKLSDTSVDEEDLYDDTARIRTAVRLTSKAVEMPSEHPPVKHDHGDKILQITDLSYSYDSGRHYALEHIDLEVYEGEILAIVGRSGCGKTTLISHLNGIVRPQSGDVTLYARDGETLSTNRKKDVAAIRQKVGLVFQYPEYQLFEETVARDIAYGLTNMGAAEDNISVRVKEAAKIAGLSEDVLDKSPFELSGGQKRRAALAGVLVMKPQVLVLDEPAAGLDPKGRHDMFETIRALRDSGTTIILVSHNMDEAARFADRIVCLKEGKKVAQGTASELFEDEKKARECGLSMPVLYDFSSKIRQELSKTHPGICLMPPLPFCEDEARSIVRSVLTC